MVWAGNGTDWNVAWRMHIHTSWVTAFSVSAKLGVFATSSLDGTVALLSLHKRKLIRVYKLESDEEVTSVRIAGSSPACLI